MFKHITAVIVIAVFLFSVQPVSTVEAVKNLRPKEGLETRVAFAIGESLTASAPASGLSTALLNGLEFLHELNPAVTPDTLGIEHVGSLLIMALADALQRDIVEMRADMMPTYSDMRLILERNARGWINSADLPAVLAKEFPGLAGLEKDIMRILRDKDYRPAVVIRGAEAALNNLTDRCWKSPVLEIAAEPLSREQIEEVLGDGPVMAVVCGDLGDLFQDELYTLCGDNRGNAVELGVYQDWLTPDGKATRRAILADYSTLALREVAFSEPVPIDSAFIVHHLMGEEQAAHKELSARFEHAGIPVANPYIAAERADSKWETYRRWRDAGIETPQTRIFRRTETDFMERLSGFVSDVKRTRNAVVVKPEAGTEGQLAERFFVTAANSERAIFEHIHEIFRYSDDALVQEKRGNIYYVDPEHAELGPRELTVRVNVEWDGEKYIARTGFARVAAKEHDFPASRGRGGSVIDINEGLRSLLFVDPASGEQTQITASADDIRTITNSAARAIEALYQDLPDEQKPKLVGIDMVLEKNFTRPGMKAVMLEANSRPGGLANSTLIVVPGSASKPEYRATTVFWDWASEQPVRRQVSRSNATGARLVSPLEISQDAILRGVLSPVLESVRAGALLPHRLSLCLAKARRLQSSGPDLPNHKLEQDRLTAAISEALVVPHPLELTKAQEIAAPAVQQQGKIDLSSAGPRAVLIVGADGYIGKRHLASLPKAFAGIKGDFTILGGLDLNLPGDETRALFAKTNPGLEFPRFFTTPQQAVSACELPPSSIIAIIATQNHIHFQNIRELAELGVREFIVEKPLADTLKETDEIIGYAREHGLKIAGAGQVFTADVADVIKQIVARRAFQPAQFLLYWTKDRTERSLSGENMQEPNIFTFDMFHQLGFIQMFAPAEGIRYAYARDMEAPRQGVIFRNHGLGVAVTGHEGRVESVEFLCFLRPGKFLPNQRTINIVGKDGSVIVADVSADDKHAETVTYINPDGEVGEIWVVPENASSMLVKAQVEFLRDVVTGTEGRPTALFFHRRMEELIEESIAKAGESEAAAATGRQTDKRPVSIRTENGTWQRAAMPQIITYTNGVRAGNIDVVFGSGRLPDPKGGIGIVFSGMNFDAALGRRAANEKVFYPPFTEGILLGMQQIDLRGKTVVVAGSTIGTHAIAAGKLGAEQVVGIEKEVHLCARAVDAAANNNAGKVWFTQGDFMQIKKSDLGLDKVDVLIVDVGGFAEGDVPWLISAFEPSQIIIAGDTEGSNRDMTLEILQHQGYGVLTELGLRWYEAEMPTEGPIVKPAIYCPIFIAERPSKAQAIGFGIDLMKVIYPEEIAPSKLDLWRHWLNQILAIKAPAMAGQAFLPQRKTVLSWAPGRGVMALGGGGRHVDYIGWMDGSLGFPIVEGLGIIMQEVDHMDGWIEVYCVDCPSDEVLQNYPDGKPRVFNMGSQWINVTFASPNPNDKSAPIGPQDIKTLLDWDRWAGRSVNARVQSELDDARAIEAIRTPEEAAEFMRNMKLNHADDIVAGAIAFLQTPFGDPSGKAKQTFDRLKNERKGLRIAIVSDLMPGGRSTSSDIVVAFTKAMNLMYNWGMKTEDIVHVGHCERVWTGTRGGVKDHGTIMYAPAFLGVSPVYVIEYVNMPTQFDHISFDTGISREMARTYSTKLEQTGNTENDIRARTGIAYALAVLWLRKHHPELAGLLRPNEDPTNPYGFGRELFSLKPVDLLKLLRGFPEKGMTRAELRKDLGPEFQEELDGLFEREPPAPPQYRLLRYKTYNLREMLQFAMTEGARSRATVGILKKLENDEIGEEDAVEQLIELTKAAHNADRTTKYEIKVDGEGHVTGIREIGWDPITYDAMLDSQIARGNEFTFMDLALGRAGYGHLERSLEHIDFLVDMIEAFNRYNGGKAGAGVIVGAGLGGTAMIVVRPEFSESLQAFLKREYCDRLGVPAKPVKPEVLGKPASVVEIDLTTVEGEPASGASTVTSGATGDAGLQQTVTQAQPDNYVAVVIEPNEAVRIELIHGLMMQGFSNAVGFPDMQSAADGIEQLKATGNSIGLVVNNTGMDLTGTIAASIGNAAVVEVPDPNRLQEILLGGSV